jgi:peptide/nickel transport system substrate-binding protein
VGYGRNHGKEKLRSRCPASAGICLLSKRRTATRLWCGVLFLALNCAQACTKQPPTTTPQRTVLTIGVPEGVAAGDLGARQLSQALSLEGLTQLSADGRVLPRLADSWQWENNNLRLRIHLHPGVIAHDGTRLSASAVANALDRALSRPANRALYPSLNTVGSVSVDNEDVLIDLTEPSVFLPEDLEINLETGSPGVGTGAFRVVSSSTSETVLERFEQFREGSPNVERIVIRPFQTLRTAWTSLLRSEVDMVTDVPPQAVEFISNDEVQVVPFERRYQYVIAFNSSKPPFNSPRVRRALNAAIDRDTLVKEVLQGRGTASTGPIWPRYWAYDPAIASYNFDPPLANSLLDSAGLRMVDSSEPSVGPRARFRFTCIVPAGFSEWERIALEVQRNLYNVGVDMQFKVVPFEQFDELIRRGNFQAALINMISGPTPGRAYIFWRSSKHFKGLNVFGYDNAETERLFDGLRTASNEAAVRSATRGLQRAFDDDPPALFLAWNQRARAVRRAFRIPDEPGRDPIYTLSKWSPAPSAGVLQATLP